MRTPQKDITIYDIAEALSLSPATVSRGLKDHPAIRKDTRKRIVDKAKEMGYQQNLFASNLRRSRSNTIGVIVPRLNSSFMSSVIAGMEKVANAAGYNLIISQSGESMTKEITNVKTLYNSRVDGLLVSLAHNTENISHFDAVLDKGIPLIFFDRVFEHPDCTSIVIDNYRAGYEVTDHLLSQGCKNLAHITLDLKRNVYADRLRGYKHALEDHKMPFDEQLVFQCNPNDHEATAVSKHILGLKTLPDGIFCASDSSAVSCMRVLKQAGIRIPEHIAIAGFNNDPVSSVIEPNLTTVNYPGEEMGEVAASTLIKRLNRLEGENLSTIVLHHDLVIRDSSVRKK